MDAARALILLLPLAGCASPRTPPERSFVHPESATDVRLIETLDAAPPDKTPPTPLEIALKMPLVVPTVAILWAKDLPRAIAEVAALPVVLVAGLLEAVGILKPEPAPAFKPRDRDR